jgi:Mor family transcriptional regulator
VKHFPFPSEYSNDVHTVLHNGSSINHLPFIQACYTSNPVHNKAERQDRYHMGRKHSFPMPTSHFARAKRKTIFVSHANGKKIEKLRP